MAKPRRVKVQPIGTYHVPIVGARYLTRDRDVATVMRVELARNVFYTDYGWYVIDQDTPCPYHSDCHMGRIGRPMFCFGGADDDSCYDIMEVYNG